jgi:hypothetical protein
MAKCAGRTGDAVIRTLYTGNYYSLLVRHYLYVHSNRTQYLYVQVILAEYGAQVCVPYNNTDTDRYQ